MFFKAESKFFDSEQLKIIDYYNEMPNFFDHNGLYFLDKHIDLPPMAKNDRKFIIHSGVFYKKTAVLSFVHNGTKNAFILNEDLMSKHNCKNIGMSDGPILKFTNRECVKSFIEEIIDDDYNVLGFIIPTKNKKEKEIIFLINFNDIEYIAITERDCIRLIQQKILQEDQVSSFSNITSIPYVFCQKLDNNTQELIFMYSDIHKYGECQTIFINHEKKQIPKSFHFYFYVLRLQNNKVIKKIFISTNDCSVSNNSKQVN